MRNFLPFAFLVTGCLYPTSEEDDDMARRVYATPEQWGQEKVFKAENTEWARRKVNVVLTRDAPPEPPLDERGHPTQPALLPQTTTLIAGVLNEDQDVAQDYSLRWVLRPGVGGARTEVRFDAVGFTRVVLPLEAFTLGLSVDPFPGSTDVPEGTVRAFAFVGEGGLGHSQAEGATFTQFFEITTTLGAEVQNIDVPEGATALRVVGIQSDGGGIQSPFNANFSVNFIQGSSLIANIVGKGAAPSDPSLLTLYASGEWFPLPGSLTKLSISLANFPAVTRGFLQFKLDL